MGIRGLHHPLYCIQCSQSDSLYAQQSRAMTFPMAEESQLHATHLSPTALKARISKCVAFELLQVGSNKIAGSIFWVIFFRAPFWCFFLAHISWSHCTKVWDSSWERGQAKGRRERCPLRHLSGSGLTAARLHPFVIWVQAILSQILDVDSHEISLFDVFPPWKTQRPSH